MSRIIRVEDCHICPFSTDAPDRCLRSRGPDWPYGRALDDPDTIPDWCPLEEDGEETP